MGKYSKVTGAKAAGDKKPYLLPGQYTVRIDKVKDVDGFEGDLFFVIEMEILKSSNEDVEVGKLFSQVIKYNQSMGPVNVKRFILCANGLDPDDPDNDDEVGEDEVELVLSDEQPLTGVEMELQCDVIETKKGTDFTKHTWFPIEDDEEEEEEKEEDEEEEE